MPKKEVTLRKNKKYKQILNIVNRPEASGSYIKNYNHVPTLKKL